MIRSLSETVKMLRGARDFLQHEMECLASPGSVDGEALGRLRDMARSFQEQAHSLLVMMVYQEASEGLQDEAETLVDVFSEAVRQIEVILAPSTRVN
jgi:hypothetical protein